MEFEKQGHIPIEALRNLSSLLCDSNSSESMLVISNRESLMSSLNSNLQDLTGSLIIHESADEEETHPYEYSGLCLRTILGGQSPTSSPSESPPRKCAPKQNFSHVRSFSHRRQTSQYYTSPTYGSLGGNQSDRSTLKPCLKKTNSYYEYKESIQNQGNLNQNAYLKPFCNIQSNTKVKNQLSPSIESSPYAELSFTDSLEDPKYFKKLPELSEKVSTTACSTLQNGREHESKHDEFFASENSFEYEAQIRSSLPILGGMQAIYRPTTAYCSNCEMEVHTKLDFRESTSLPGPVLKILTQVFSCCQTPIWLRKWRIHKCSVCGETLAKS